MQPESDMPHVGDRWLSATEVADILWLASFVDPLTRATAWEEEGENVGPTSGNVEGENDTKEEVQAINESDQQEPEPVASVYHGGDVEKEENTLDGWGGVGFKSPRAPAILEKTAIIRSLRPLQRRVSSTREFVLHEAETSEQIAVAMMGRGSWLPVRYPAEERWLDLVVLVDGAPSMALWQQTVEEFIALLSATGFFRNVQRWTLAVEEVTGAVNDEQKTELYLYPAQTTPDSAYRRRSATELLDQQRRRLFVVISDCSSVVWESGAAQRLLQPLAKHNLVSLMQVLPEEMWKTTALGLAKETRLIASQALSTNAELNTGKRQRNANHPIPVVSLESESLRVWAGFLAGHERRSVVGYYLSTEDDVTIDVDQALQDLGITPQPPQAEPDVSVADLFSRFRERVPRRARPLAYYFAAAPLTLPVMHMVQAALLPKTTHADFVRVFYSGLIRRVTAQTVDHSNNDIVYDFVGGEAMREYLLTKLSLYEAKQVVNMVIMELSRYVQERLDQPGTFDAIIAVPGVQGPLRLDTTAQHFAEVTTKILRYLGGVYGTLADNLEQLILPEPPSEDDSTRAATLADSLEQLDLPELPSEDDSTRAAALADILEQVELSELPSEDDLSQAVMLEQPDDIVQQQIDRVKLRQVLSDNFSEAELKLLCFELNIDYGNLPHTQKLETVLAIIDYCKHREQIPELVDYILAIRKHLLLDDLLLESAPSTSDLPIDFEFVNRAYELDLICKPGAPRFTLVDGAVGYGKTSLLFKIKEIYENKQRESWKVAYIDLKQDPFMHSEDIRVAWSYIANAIIQQFTLPTSVPVISVEAGEESIVNTLVPFFLRQRANVFLLLDSVEVLPRSTSNWLKKLIYELDQGLQKGQRKLRVVFSGRYVSDWGRGAPYPLTTISLGPFNSIMIHEMIAMRVSDLNIQLDHQYLDDLTWYVSFISGGHPQAISYVLDTIAEYEFVFHDLERAFFQMPFQYDKQNGTLFQVCIEPIIQRLISDIRKPLQEVFIKLSPIRRFNLEILDIFLREKIFSLHSYQSSWEMIQDMLRTGLVNPPTANDVMFSYPVTRRLLAMRLQLRDTDFFNHMNVLGQKLFHEMTYKREHGINEIWRVAVIESLYHTLQLTSREEPRRMLQDTLIERFNTYLADIKDTRDRQQLVHLRDALARDMELSDLINRRTGNDTMQILLDLVENRIWS